MRAGSNAAGGISESPIEGGLIGEWLRLTAIAAGIAPTAALVVRCGGLVHSVPVASAAAKLSRSSIVAVLSQARPPGQPLTFGGAKSGWPMAVSRFTSACCGNENF